jgi:hypothetical protein
MKATIPGTGTHMTTLSETLNGLRGLGYEVDLRIDEEGYLCADGVKMRYSANDLSLAWTRRFEGQSNPDDLAILYGLRFPNDKIGVLVDGYGPASDPKVTEFIKAVQPV